MRQPAKIKNAGPASLDQLADILLVTKDGNAGLRIITGSVPTKNPAMISPPPEGVPLAAAARKAGVKVAHGKKTVMTPSKKSAVSGNLPLLELKFIFKIEVPRLISL